MKKDEKESEIVVKSLNIWLRKGKTWYENAHNPQHHWATSVQKYTKIYYYALIPNHILQ